MRELDLYNVLCAPGGHPGCAFWAKTGGKVWAVCLLTKLAGCGIMEIRPRTSMLGPPKINRQIQQKWRIKFSIFIYKLSLALAKYFALYRSAISRTKALSFFV